MRIDKNTTIKLGDRNIIKIKIGENVIWEKSTVNYFYIQNTSEGDNTVTFKTSASNTLPSSDLYSNQVEYSTDKRNWNTLTFVKNTPQTVTISGGEKLYLRNNSGTFNYFASYTSRYTTTINTSQSCILGGNINTLLDYNDADNVSLKQSCFYELFRGCTSLTDVSNLELPSTTLSSYCYYNMFYGCTSLINTPSLPTTTLADSCYYGMFYNCKSLTTAPTLPATTLANSCYESMFQGCTSLTTTPELPVTELANKCYSSMFRGCTSLTTTSELPATTLADSCYNYMFFGCKALTSAPTLPATTLANSCYNSMFQDCTSLTTTPELPATTLANSCYNYMFQGCTGLTSTPTLPATELANSCYNGMFRGCTGLTSAPTLPATTLKPQCYNSMFSGCTGLTSTPTLPATELANSCYNGMFNNCTSLVTTPSLPATNLANACYQRMFSGCTGLTSTPTLPATTLADYCYQSMFSGCTSLVNAPELPATTLTTSCYREMFNGCSSLVNAPELPATKLVSSCYYRMFYNCSLINEVTVYADDISANNCTSNWLSGVASTGTFYNYGAAEYNIGSTSGVPSGWTEVRPDYFYVANTYEGTNTISVKQTIVGSPDSSLYSKTLQYSKDKTNWSTIILSDAEYNISLNSGEILYMRGNDGVLNYYTGGGSTSVITNILGTQSHTIGGNINTLVNYITPNELTLTQGVFYSLFRNNTTLTSSENLTLPPSSDGSVSVSAYLYMFSGCSSMITPPQSIPATKISLNSCTRMFNGCSSLTTPPELPATVLYNYSYQGMFQDCTSLQTAPSLPATNVPYMAYHRMFNDCSSLVTAPELPATTIGSGAYQYMFMGCSNLQNAPSELPAETLALNSYYEMFRGCSQLTTAPIIKAKTFAENSCQGMFASCTSLNSITVYADDISATNCTSSWLSGVASTGTFNNYGSATYTINSVSGIPTGWTEVKPDYFYVENTYNGSNTISVKQTITGQPDSSLYSKTLQYSKDKTNWSTITLSSTEHNINLNQGERVYFRGNEGVLNYWYSAGAKKVITNILGTQSHTIGGNINTLINYYNPNNLTLSQGVFNSLFENDTNLTSSSDIILPPPSNGVLPSYAYLYLFKNCTNMVTTLSELPSVKQGEDSCNGMFARTAITTAPALPSMELAKNCYYSLFEGCTSLVNPPALPATEMKPNCYRSLFYGCTSLVNVPKLPATKMATGCYQNIFRDCTSLVNPPELPATTLADSCYYSMFEGCSKLVNPPDLPATEMKPYCYKSLFYRCSSLVYTPELPAKVLAEGCYLNIFRNCPKINNITVYADDISATDCTKYWLSGVASTGTFNNMGSATYIKNSANGIPTGWVEKKPNEPDYFYVENTHNGNNNIYVKTRAGYSGTEPTGEFATTLEYSKDKTNWTTINLNYDYHMNGSNLVTSLVTNLTLSLSVGEKVYFRNTSGYFGYVGDKGTHSHQFSSDENIKVGGNIKSLLDYRDMVGTTMKKGCFYEMFFESYTLRDASELILPDTVADSCYLKLFSSCVYLTSIPSLPALTMAPSCYCEMLKNTAITTPPALPSTNLAEYCYKNMLEGTPITTAPALPATTLSVGCYQGLFNSCNKLTTAPVLKATTLVDYCYRYLFMGCTKLNSITTYANNINAEECTRWWLESVASSGTLHNMGSATYVTDSGDGIPTGWTEVKS